MKIWQLISPNNLQRSTVDDLKLSPGFAKAKITKALLSEADVAVYSGSTKVKYPLTLGRFAIGQITETGEDTFMQKGDRVYFSSTLDSETSQRGFVITGETTDGFYRDFALVGVVDAYVLPPSVSDEAAFLIDAVALAEHVVDEMNISVGQHILVVGGGLYSNVLCQILIYHRAVPILADNNPERLARAKRSGIYYTFPNDETLKENVLSVTGGKLADGAIFLAFNNRQEASSVFSYLAHGAYATFCSMTEKNISINLEEAMKRNVTIKGITESREFVTTAINILANKAVNFNEFPYNFYSEEKLPELLEQRATELKNNALPEQMDVLKFVF